MTPGGTWFTIRSFWKCVSSAPHLGPHILGICLVFRLGLWFCWILTVPEDVFWRVNTVSWGRKPLLQPEKSPDTLSFSDGAQSLYGSSKSKFKRFSLWRVTSLLCKLYIAPIEFPLTPHLSAVIEPSYNLSWNCAEMCWSLLIWRPPLSLKAQKDLRFFQVSSVQWCKVSMVINDILKILFRFIIVYVLY